MKFFGVACRVAGKPELVLDIEGRKVKDLMACLDRLYHDKAAEHISPDFFAKATRYNIVLVNGKDLSVLGGLDTELKDGDEVTVITFAHGG